MSSIDTKFSIGDVCYTFDDDLGIIYRSVVAKISISSNRSDLEISYTLTSPSPDPPTGGNYAKIYYEQTLHTEDEIKDIANTWLIQKSVSIFSNTGL